MYSSCIRWEHSSSVIDNFFISIFGISLSQFPLIHTIDSMLLLSCNGITNSSAFCCSSELKIKKNVIQRMLVSHHRLVNIHYVDKHGDWYDDCDSCANFNDRATLTPDLSGSPIFLRSHWLYFRAGKDEIIANI